jgi:predicted nucleic acid-binding Zn ribbon protein
MKFSSPICEICGKVRRTYHPICSRKLQLLHADRKTKKAPKILNKDAIAYLTKTDEWSR